MSKLLFVSAAAGGSTTLQQLFLVGAYSSSRSSSGSSSDNYKNNKILRTEVEVDGDAVGAGFSTSSSSATRGTPHRRSARPRAAAESISEISVVERSMQTNNGTGNATSPANESSTTGSSSSTAAPAEDRSTAESSEDDDGKRPLTIGGVIFALIFFPVMYMLGIRRECPCCPSGGDEAEKKEGEGEEKGEGEEGEDVDLPKEMTM